MTATLLQAHLVETCAHCRTVDVTIAVHGAVTIDADGLTAAEAPITPHGYSGVDAHGRPVCPMCWCSHCGGGHTLLTWREACAAAASTNAVELACDEDPDDPSDRLYEIATGR